MEAGSEESIVRAGIEHHVAGRLEQAIECYRRGIAARPDWHNAHANLSIALLQLGRVKEAIEAGRASVRCCPEFAIGHKVLGDALATGREFEAAAESYGRVIALAPEDAGAHAGLAEALRTLGQLDEAMAEARAAVRLAPKESNYYGTLARFLTDTEQIKEALAVHDQAIALNPADPVPHWKKAWTLLVSGDWAAGWPEFDWRRRVPGFVPRRQIDRPIWDGRREVAGKTVFLHAEYGLGDTIQFVRYATLVAQRGARVIVDCHPELRKPIETVPGLSGVMTSDDPVPHFDEHAPLMALPGAFRTTVDTVPAEVPYISADPALAVKWRERLASGSGLKVGVVWSGNPQHPNDHNRSIPAGEFAGLAKHEATLYSLQKGNAQPPPAPVIDLTGEITDFADTAAIIAGLDLVIAVDTAVAHLAGAMAKPVWTLLPYAPDWRWMLKREDSPWYPTMRLFQQPRPRDWASVFRRVRDELTRFHANPAL